MTNYADQNREQKWFTMRMNIKTQAGMLRQYQMEEQERGYKIQTLEFKSPQYILKNFISGNSPIRVAMFLFSTLALESNLLPEAALLALQ